MYIITEDSNSARDFWQCVAQTFRSVDSFLLVSFPIGSDGQTASGNTTLKAQVLSIFPKLQAGDKVFVAVDCVANNTKGFIAHDFVKWGTRLCMKKGAEFVATSYWCFEDLYLSYDEVLAMYLKNPVAENVVIAALQYVHDNLQNGTDYFDTSREIQNFIDLHNSAGKNREHFANELLMEVTRALKGNGHFAITKSVGAFRKSAECWLRDCSDIKEDVLKMEECGEYIGLAFQIQDDILDLTGDEEEIGKPVGSDEKNHKTTYVTLKGLERSQRDVEDISKKAIDILEKYDKGDCYLTNLTRFLIHRTH